MTAYALLANGAALSLADIPAMSLGDLRSLILEKVAGGSHLASFFAFPRDGGMRLAVVMTSREEGGLAVGIAPVGDSFPSLTPECPAAEAFEREIAEQWGIVPLGHPWLKPLRSHAPLAGEPDSRLSEWFGAARGPGMRDYFRVDGDAVHEVAVGPVHAGVIEPGHFRFQCHGETVMHLEIALGYQHRGIETALRGGPAPLTRHLLETAAGDTACGHGLAYAMVMEALAGLSVSEAADRVRAVGLELERIANHVGDLGALAGDVGFLPTANYCGRLRGDILNLTARICGNRFGRGLIAPGGVGHSVPPEMAAGIAADLATAMRGIRGAAELMFTKPAILTRFEDLGTVDRLTADHLGMVGPAARASGLEVDIRLDLPHGAYRRDSFNLPLGDQGDVLDRARQRLKEIVVSAELVAAWLAGDCAAVPVDSHRPPEPRPDSFAVSLTEAWRGQLCHAAVTDAAGRFLCYKVTDPSFHNWFGLAMAMRGQQISDFPICNKSFNLSYCGHDL